MSNQIERIFTYAEVWNKYYDYQDVGGEEDFHEFVIIFFTPAYDCEFNFLGWFKRNTFPANAQIQD